MTTLHDECYSCIHMATIPGDAHIQCTNPDENMEGHKHGIKSGWFNYPFNFDPTWKLKWCSNHRTQKDEDDAYTKLADAEMFDEDVSDLGDLGNK